MLIKIVFSFPRKKKKKKKKTIVSYCRFQEGSDMFGIDTYLCGVYAEQGPDRHFASSNQNSDIANFMLDKVIFI